MRNSQRTLRPRNTERYSAAIALQLARQIRRRKEEKKEKKLFLPGAKCFVLPFFFSCLAAAHIILSASSNFEAHAQIGPHFAVAAVVWSSTRYSFS